MEFKNDLGKPWRYQDGDFEVIRTSMWSPPGCHPVGCGLKIYVKDGGIDLAAEYGDILGNIDGQEVIITLDPSSWLVSVVFFKPETELVRIDLSVPDCIGSVGTALTMLADVQVNLISVFTKVMISYQNMYIEVVADITKSKYPFEQLESELKKYLSPLNGIYELKSIRKL